MRASIHTAGLLLTCLALPAQSLVRVTPTADVTVDSARPATNLGSDLELSFGETTTSTAPAAGLRRAYLRFDLTPALRRGEVPVRVTLLWFQSRSNVQGCNTVSVHAALDAWSESALTWTNQPAHDPAVAGMACVGDMQSPGFKAFHITELAHRWLDRSLPNHGLVLRELDEAPGGPSRPGFGHSREFPIGALQPHLEFEFATTIGVGCAAAAPEPTLGFGSGSARVGDTLELRARGFTLQSNVVILLGLTPRPSPLSLAPIGLPHCSLNVFAELQGAVATPTSGVTTRGLRIPGYASLSGRSIFAQCVAVTPGSALELTNGLEIPLHD